MLPNSKKSLFLAAGIFHPIILRLMLYELSKPLLYPNIYVLYDLAQQIHTYFTQPLFLFSKVRHYGTWYLLQKAPSLFAGAQVREMVKSFWLRAIIII